MVAAVMGAFYKGAEAFIIILAATIGLFSGGRTIAIVPPQPAATVVSNAAAQMALILPTRPAAFAASSTVASSAATFGTVIATATTATTGPVALAEITPGLLPKVVLNTETKTAAAATPKPAAPKPAPVAIASLATADWLLAHATTTFVRRVGGGYGIVFSAVSGGETVLSWPYGATTIGGSGGIPQFSAAYDCNPPPASSPSPTFAVRTSYDCTVSLTALAGADKRTQSQTFTLATGHGEFLASPPANMDTHLTDSENDGGFVFTNDDTKPIAVLSETFAVSYTGLSTGYGPLILRLIDPGDATNYIDYHLENIPAVSSSSYLHSATGITLSMPLTIGAANAKMLPVEVLDVHKLSVTGVDPAVTITLTGVTTDRTDFVMRLGTPQISWSCVVALGYYDPNATSGPFATGEACKN